MNNKNIGIFAVIILVIIILLPSLFRINSDINSRTQPTEPINSPTIQNQDIPNATAFINDYANLLPQSTFLELETTLKNFSENGKGEIAILTVKSMNGLNIDEFAIRVAEKWKVGKKGIDNGIIMIIAVSERKVKIETGRGSSITDGQAGEILDTYMVPLLKQNKWKEAIIAGTNALIAKIN